MTIARSIAVAMAMALAHAEGEGAHASAVQGTLSAIDLNATRERLFRAPEGPFAILLFPEGALGDSVGVIYYGDMGNPEDGAWRLSDRLWQRSPWADNVTAFVWSSDGRYLFVSTSGVYGTGAVYRLNLFERRYTTVYAPKVTIPNGTPTTVVISLNEHRHTLRVRVDMDAPNGHEEQSSSREEDIGLP